MSIITYPLNGVTYDAEDVSTYLCTRTSGVYSKDTNYAVSVTGARQIAVAPGLAWINYDDFKGVSACSREAVNLTVPDADSTLSRIDRVVLQFDTAANLTAVKLKTGTPAAAPEPPAILQNHNQYELGLCTVSVPAGSSVVTAADITDTRADEAVCGVMRDGVTGIPTAQLVEQAKAKVAGLEETATASAQAAEQSAAAAAKSQREAASSASTATTQAQAAARSATAASTSQSAAAGSASTASGKAQEAASSADAAARDKTATANSASAAAVSAKAAAQSAAEAKAAASTDKTLTMDGAPADAKATGDALAQRYTKDQADAKFGTPYSLPPATADQLGGVKVGEALDIAPDGTLSAKTLNDKIAAAVAVKSEPRLVWNHYEETGKKWKTYDIKMPDGLDYVHVKTKYNSPTGGYGEEVDIAKGGTANHSYGNGTGIFASNTTFQTNGTLHFATETSTGGYTVEIWLTGYHYPTLAELVAETQAAQADTDALAVDQEYRVAMLELGLTDHTTTDTTT